MHMAKSMRTKGSLILICCNLLVLLTSRTSAQVEGRYFLTTDSLQRHERIWLNRNWKYHAGDNNDWAKPAYVDSAWETASTLLEPDQPPQSGWPGLGWFRLHVFVDSTLWHEPLLLAIAQAGAAAIYLDGKLIYDLGDDGGGQAPEAPSRYRDYAAFSFSNESKHVFAIRYANHATATFHRAGRAAGFALRLGHANAMIALGVRNLEADLRQQMFFTTLALAFGILHLVLFLFSPRAKSHLYFTIFVFLYAANIFFDYQHFLADDLRSSLLYLRIHRAVMPYGPACALLFIYSLFSERIPKQFWFIAAGLAITGALAVLKPIDNLNYIQIFAVAAVIEMIRVTRLAIREKREGAWIIASGFLLLFLFSSYDLLLDLNLMAPMHDISNGYPFGFLGLIIAMSVYLARDFARTNEKILAQERHAQEQEMQQLLLQADNARKTTELEEARQLQLAMLPHALPQLPNLEIATHMKPATEVGGDYYDFNLAEDGTLTVAIGDATGHGMKAGTVVTAAKSLFQVLAPNRESPQIFQEFTQALKSMNLGRMYMAMTIIKLKNNKIKVATVGMPPTLIYRAATQEVEEINIKAMPLGSFSGFPYRQEELEIRAGDTIVLMSDGLPERLNRHGEILDYSGAKNSFEQVAGRSPQEIIAHLVAAGESWADGHPQKDDVTFVVMKVKG